MVMPLNVLEKSVNKRIQLLLKDNRQLEGKLVGYDDYMNMVLEDTEETKDENVRRIGTVVLRGKNVAPRLNGTFAVYNGDVIDSLDFSKFVAFHRKREALATIALFEVPDPSAFGVVTMDGSRVTRFVEKPAPGEAPSRLVNAGRYLFEPEVLDGIESGRPVSMETEVFPALARKGLSGFPFEGYWSDAGTLEGYLAATRILLANGGAAVDPKAKVARARLDGAVLVAEGCEVSGRLGPNVVLGSRCRCEPATACDSVLLDGASVEAGAVVTSSIIGEDSFVGPGAAVEGSIVGDGARVRKGRRLTA